MGMFGDLIIEEYQELSKMPKKKREEYFKKFRGDWNGVNPVSRIKPSKKVYKRKKKVEDE